MKKTLTNLSILMLIVLASALPKKSNACIDYATEVWVTCEYSLAEGQDTCIKEILVTVHNLRLFGGDSNHFCSCAVNSYTDFFSDIKYVAFVDSGTDEPIDGFLPFEKNSNASNAWKNAWGSGDWWGFVAGVSKAGLLPGKAVDLKIRACPPEGYKPYLVGDTVFGLSQLGTDEWDDDNNTLANSHQSITWLTSGGAPTLQKRDSMFFVNYDQEMKIKLSTGSIYAKGSLTVYPNPSSGIFKIDITNNEKVNTIEVYNSSGQLIKQLVGERRELNLEENEPGIYFITIKTDNSVYQHKINLY